MTNHFKKYIKMVKNNNSKPVFNFNMGQVRGAVFINENEENTWYSTKINKSYNEGSKKKPEYKETNNYNNLDLADLTIVANECYKYVKTHFPNDEE